jgi:hypothetical protein
MDTEVARAKVRHAMATGQVGMDTQQTSESKHQSEQSLTDLGCGLVDHDIPISEKDRKPIKFSLVLCKKKGFRTNEQKSNLKHKNRKSRG